MSKEEVILERLKLENQRLKLEVEKQQPCYSSWLIFPLMWVVYGAIHCLLTLL